MTKSSAALASLVAAILLVFAGPAMADPTPDVAYPDDPELQRAYEDGFYRGASEGYTDGRDEGYEDGYEAGKSLGETSAHDQEDAEDLRDQVEGEVEEGGSDLGPQITTPTPTPTATTETNYVDESVDEPKGSGIPWWPLSFAVVATVWFVTRRRRLDAEDSAAEHD